MPPRETGKQRVARIPPDYFRRANLLDRGRVILAWLAAGVVLVWWLATHWTGGAAAALASPGPLVAAHAMWQKDCAACHVDFRPVRSDAVLISKEATALNNQKCVNCHQAVLGSSASRNPLGHHPTVLDAETGCASCHHEHLGSDRSLASVDAQACVVCHGKQPDRFAALRVGASILPVGAKPLATIARFDVDHPSFRSLERTGASADPRNLKFPHRLHMTEGLAQDEKHVANLTLGMLNAADRARYAGNGHFDLAANVKLDCAACHEPSTDRRSSGAGLSPVRFERNCQACHPLTIDPGASQVASDRPTDNGLSVVVRHGLSRDQLIDEVRKYWEDKLLHDNPRRIEVALPTPGHHQPEATSESKQWLNSRIEASLSHLRRVCLKCHVDGVKEIATTLSSADELSRWRAPSILPVNIPKQWLPLAQFDHSQHQFFDTGLGRRIDCRDCHAGADPGHPLEATFDGISPENDAPLTGKESSAERSRSFAPMIPNRDTCLRCHNPHAESPSKLTGGARFDCGECHRYHGRNDISLDPATSR